MNDTHNIPASIVEAAARALCEYDQTPLSATDDPAVADHYRHHARAVLAAALAECEVREEWRSTKPYVLPWGTDPYAQHHRWDERRLVITTPAEDVTAMDTPTQEETP